MRCASLLFVECVPGLEWKAFSDRALGNQYRLFSLDVSIEECRLLCQQVDVCWSIDYIQGSGTCILLKGLYYAGETIWNRHGTIHEEGFCHSKSQQDVDAKYITTLFSSRTGL